jgi:hypothetical protein
MSSSAALLSATFHEPGVRHLVELVHQRDGGGARRLGAVDVAVYDETGKERGAFPVDLGTEVLDVGRAVDDVMGGGGRAMVLFDTRYDPAIFPYRPHHYGYLHHPGGTSPPLYYAVSAVLGGVPDRLEATRLNNFETYVFRARAADQRFSLMIGNVARFASAAIDVFVHYAGARVEHHLSVAPKAHLEFPLPPRHEGQPLTRVEVKSVFRVANYVVGRHGASGALVVFDHLFTYLR